MGGGRTRRVFLEEFIKAELKPTWFITVSFEQEWNWTKGGFTVCCEVLRGGLNVESAAENWRHISLVLIPMVPIKSTRRKWNAGSLLFQSVFAFFFLRQRKPFEWMNQREKKKDESGFLATWHHYSHRRPHCSVAALWRYHFPGDEGNFLCKWHAVIVPASLIWAWAPLTNPSLIDEALTAPMCACIFTDWHRH